MTPTIAEADRACARVNREHGVTYYWAAQLLGRDRRRHVHALYALCRRADDLVDVDAPVDERRARLERWRREFVAAIDGAPTDDPVLMAATRTVRTFDLDRSLFERFFTAMAADLTTTTYPDWETLVEYMDGSAAVIGEMMLPILGPYDASAALEPARHLGLAFQLTNFLRDVGDDLDLGRQYLPQADLATFDVDLGGRTVTPQFVALMRFEIERCRHLYEVAATGLDLLPRTSRRCIATALRSYRAILDEIERHDYDVFAGRISVSAASKARIALAELVRR